MGCVGFFFSVAGRLAQLCTLDIKHPEQSCLKLKNTAYFIGFLFSAHTGTHECLPCAKIIQLCGIW